MANRVRPIAVSEADRHELERLQRSTSAAAGLSRRARAVLLMVQNVSGVEIAAPIPLLSGSGSLTIPLSALPLGPGQYFVLARQSGSWIAQSVMFYV